ncbi:rab proteins geranylgeranyltransferase component A-like isoform X4 [Dreissena polymorpha]|uniref:rab proteins geranylgeranyltransferase component A-like isoform X4 n=1 Tax=Dreissena polymorpha TaxID=45954 RepID=UPI002264B804|nr:rab proteins geranylgeranyltransferase component A-like isoform X4 [Dreissena polymorpha]
MDLPNEFDVVVLGTGMPESIVAAAFSRIGQRVLHLDKNDHYSGDWASFNLKSLEEWAERHAEGSASVDCIARPAVNDSEILESNERLIEMPLNKTSFSNAVVEYFVSGTDENNEKIDENQQEAGKETPDIPENLEARVVKPVESEDHGKTEQSTHKDELTPSHIESHPGQSKPDDVTEVSDRLAAVGVAVKEATENGDASNATLGKADKPQSSETIGGVQQEIKARLWTTSRIKSEWRRFNLDLSPKVLFSVGDMVELLIQSDIAKYCEFKTVTQILTVMKGTVEKVPCSRSDVFSSQSVSMLEKRMLMKFIQFCLDYENKMEELGDVLDAPFTDFLASRNLTPTIQHYVQHAIAMATESMATRQGLLQMKKFLKSLGRYGNTPFLWSLYGSGEMPQSFCRMCAVFGGVYCLRTTASAITVDETNRCTGIVTTEGKKIKCKWLIMSSSYAPDQFLSISGDKRLVSVSRGVLLTEKSLLTTGQQEQLSMMCLPCPDDGDRPINVLELPPSSMAAPPGLYVYHLTRMGKKSVSPKDDLQYAVDTLFSKDCNETKPRILWSLFFTQTDMSQVSPSACVPENVFLMSGPGAEIDIDRPVSEAREVFKKILPNEEFLPKAPNPEDIIYIDDSEAQAASSNSQSEFEETSNGQSEPSLIEDREESENQANDRLVEEPTNESVKVDSEQA